MQPSVEFPLKCSFPATPRIEIVAFAHGGVRELFRSYRYIKQMKEMVTPPGRNLYEPAGFSSNNPAVGNACEEFPRASCPILDVTGDLGVAEHQYCELWYFQGRGQTGACNVGMIELAGEWDVKPRDGGFPVERGPRRQSRYVVALFYEKACRPAEAH